ncbi:Golgi transport complex subunit 3 [Xylographa parallela]|nr:Golgi transport complex subunit 3 [Xylographa parallela]
MYDDASYYAFVPSAYASEEKAAPTKHRRKTSLLAQPNEGAQANGSLTGGTTAVQGYEEETHGPPKATLSRRAQSYTDFHHAVRAVLRAESASDGHDGKKADEIKDDFEFTEWYQSIEDDLLEASHIDYRQAAYHDQLKFTESYLESLSSTTSATLDILSSLSQSFGAVEAQTTAFQKQCEDLVAEQHRVTRLADDIGENLQYYSYLEPITRRLNAPGAGSFVRGREFSDMLARLDECLGYMTSHPLQREAATYRSRYRLLLTRGLTLIRVHFVGALRDIAQDVNRRIADRQLNDTTMSALLYAKFRVGASELKETAQEIRKRAILPEGAEPGAEAEYQSLTNELYTSYSATRGRLVIPLVVKKLADIAQAPSTSKDLVAFARTSIGYVKGVCSDEHELWRDWFEGEDGLYDFLESVCEPLYDHLRPRIIHENQLLKLCELCTLLQTRYMRDQDEESEMVDLNQLDFSTLIQSALEDAQTRLVFRTQAILRDEIENYKPKPEDLDYPIHNKQVTLPGSKHNGPVTSGRKGSVAETSIPKDPVIVEESDSPSARYGFDVEATFQGWYPTLRKAIWLLSRIYRLVNSAVFDDLAHEIVHQTTLSLHRASTLIAARSMTTDAQLFLLKHLLLLKQQIVAFDIEYVTPDVSFDFSGVTNTFYELRDRGGLFDPRNLWRFVGGGLLPRVVENMLDAKVELDGRLRTIINDFTTSAAERMTHTINEKARGKKNFDASIALQKTQELTAKEVPLLRHKLDEYLDDMRTKETLVGAVQHQVVMNYESFYEWFAAGKRATGGKVGKKGKGREDDVWDADTFGDWAEEVFGVRGVGMIGMNGGQSRSQSGSRNVSGSVSRDGSM